MHVGIIGLGKSGKSSLYYSLTGQMPEPPSGKAHRRLGVAYVPEPRVELIAKLDCSKKTSFPEITFIDPEGFPAETGKNLNSEMLGMVRESELIALVIRAFSNPAIMHPSGSIDGKRDLDVCFGDLIIQDLAVLEHRHRRIRKDFERGKKELKRELDAVERAMACLESGIFIRQSDLNDSEKEQLIPYELLTMKPAIVIWNVNDDAEFGRGGRGVSQEIKTICEERGCGIGSASLSIETEIMEMDPEDRKAFLEDLGVVETVRDRFLGAVYKRLGLITFFTGGPKE
ncbi:MAG: hypothetical protein ABIC40_00050, partial [bacterium]